MPYNVVTKLRNGAPIVAAGLIVVAWEMTRKYWPMIIAGICVAAVLALKGHR